MFKILFTVFLFALFAAQVALAVPAYMYDASGNPISSTGGALNVSSSAGPAQGSGASDHARISYSGTNVTTSAYVQLLASTSNAINAIEIFDSSGQTLLLATGAAASEADQIYIIPGGNGRIPLSIATGTRISLKAVTGTASAGEIDVNFYK